MRQQQVEFDMAAEVVRTLGRGEGTPPAQVLFPQVLAIVQKYVREYVKPVPPWKLVDVGCSPYFGWAVERIQPLILGPKYLPERRPKYLSMSRTVDLAAPPR